MLSRLPKFLLYQFHRITTVFQTFNCIDPKLHIWCDIIYPLVRYHGRSRRSPAPLSGPLGGPSWPLGGSSRPLGGPASAVRWAVRAVRRAVRAVRRSGRAVRRGVCLEVTEKRVILAVDEKSDSRSWWEKSNSRSWREESNSRRCCLRMNNSQAILLRE